MGDLFSGGGSKAPQFAEPRFSGGGLFSYADITDDYARTNVAATPERQAFINSIVDQYKQAGTSVRGFIPQFDQAFGSGVAAIDALLPQVSPGFGRLTDAGVTAINNNRNAAIGDINSNLSKRRVLGSSFGQNQIAQTAQSFADQEEQFRAESFLQELDLTNRLETQKTELQVENLNQQMNSTLKAFELEIAGDELKLEDMNMMANMAASLMGQTAEIVNQNRLMAAQAKASSSNGFAQLAGTIIGGSVGNAAGGGSFDMGSLTSALSGTISGGFSDLIGGAGLAGSTFGKALGGFNQGSSVIGNGETVFWR